MTIRLLTALVLSAAPFASAAVSVGAAPAASRSFSGVVPPASEFAPMLRPSGGISADVMSFTPAAPSVTPDAPVFSLSPGLALPPAAAESLQPQPTASESAPASATEELGGPGSSGLMPSDTSVPATASPTNGPEGDDATAVEDRSADEKAWSAEGRRFDLAATRRGVRPRAQAGKISASDRAVDAGASRGEDEFGDNAREPVRDAVAGAAPVVESRSFSAFGRDAEAPAGRRLVGAGKLPNFERRSAAVPAIQAARPSQRPVPLLLTVRRDLGFNVWGAAAQAGATSAEAAPRTSRAIAPPAAAASSGSSGIAPLTKMVDAGTEEFFSAIASVDAAAGRLNAAANRTTSAVTAARPTSTVPRSSPVFAFVWALAILPALAILVQDLAS